MPVLSRGGRAAGVGALQVLRLRAVRQEGQVPLSAQGVPLQVLPLGAGLCRGPRLLQVQPRAPQ